MGAAVEQEIRVKIKALVDGLKSVQELQSAVKTLQSQGNKKLGIDTDKPAAGLFKFFTELRKVSPELDSVATRAENLSGVLGAAGLSGTLGPLGIILGVAATAGLGFVGVLFALAKHAAEYANRIGELQDKTGLAAETLSAVGLAAENTDSNIEEFADGFVKLNRTIAEGAAGEKEATEKLKRLGIEPQQGMRDLDGVVSQVFKKIADAPNAAEAARLATDAFGKSGAKLLPTIKSFDGDLNKAKETAREFGRLLTNEGVRAARQFDDNMDALHSRASGLVATLGNQLIPEFNRLFNLLINESRNSGSVINTVFQGILFLLHKSVNDTIVLIAAIKTAAELAKIASSGPVGQATAVIVARDVFNRNLKETADAANTAPALPDKAPPAAAGGGKAGGKSHKSKLAELLVEAQKTADDVTAAGREANTADLADQLEREKRLITQQLEARIISYREYYSTLARIETDAIDNEILRQQEALFKIDEELKRKRAEIAADKSLTPGERVLKETAAGNEANAKATPILQKINELERDRAAVTSRIAAEARKTTEEYQRQIGGLRNELARLNGDGAEAAKREIDERFREIRERAVANGDAAAVAVIDALKKRLRQKSQFDDIAQQIQEEFQKIRDAQDAIDAEVATGSISQEEAERRKLDVARLHRAELERLHGELKGIAEATKDPELLAAVNRLGVEIAQVGVQVDKLAQDINRDLKQALDDTLFAIIRRQQTLKEAVTSLVNHILDELARLASSAIIEELFGEHGIFGGIFNSKGGQGGIGGILSGIFGPRNGGNNPQAPQGNVGVLNSIPLIIKDFQGNTATHLQGIKGNTFNTVTEVRGGFGQMIGLTGQTVSLLGYMVGVQKAQQTAALLKVVGSIILGAVTKRALGGFEGATPGGRLVQVAEGGFDELVVTTDPRHRQRTAALLAQFIGRTGIMPDFRGHAARLAAAVAPRLPALAMGDFVSNLPAANLPAASGETHIHMHGTYPVTSDGKLTKQSEAAIERNAARATRRGMQRTIASNK